MLSFFCFVFRCVLGFSLVNKKLTTFLGALIDDSIFTTTFLLIANVVRDVYIVILGDVLRGFDYNIYAYDK